MSHLSFGIRMTLIYLVCLCWTLFDVPMCSGIDNVVNYINVNPGKTIVLMYSYTATSVDWIGPSHENKQVVSEEQKDMYGITRKWNVTRYVSNRYLNPLLPHKERLQIVGNERKGQFYLQIKNVSTYDAGLYICDIFILNQAAVRKTFIIQVNYSPSVRIVYDNFTESEKERFILCNATGHPNNFTYGRWEHKSLLDEHIRYLSGNATGFLGLPIQKRAYRYQDTGVYICSVSNGITDTGGQLLQKQQAYIISKGPPHLVEDNRSKQHGREGYQMDVKVYALSLSNITCQHIALKSGLQVTYSIKTNCVKMNADFFGKTIKVKGWEIVFMFPELRKTAFNKYVITVCNEFGNSSFTLQILPVVKSTSAGKILSVQGILSVVLLIIIIGLLGVIGIGFRYIKETYRKRLRTILNIQIAATNSDDESAHYIEIIENDNVLTSLQEQSNHDLSTDVVINDGNLNTMVLSEEHHSEILNYESDTIEHTSTSSEHGRNGSEYSDDGYERPYTTLVVNHHTEDEHVYRTTQKISNNDNVSCKHSTEFTQPESSIEITHREVRANNGQESSQLYYFEENSNETETAFRQSNVQLRKHKAEYINLSLKQ